jgi:O-antigen/teichoic acid export membrane protein
MRSNAQTVVKNASFLLISQLATWALTLVLTIVLARYLGATLVGEYTLASSIWTIMGVFINFGMDTLLIKQIARTPEQTPELFGTTIVARTILFILSCGLVALYAHFAHFSATTMVLVGLLGIAQLATQLYLATQASLQGLELMHYVSVAGVASRIINTVLGIAVLVLGYGVYGIGIITIVAMVVGLVLQYVFLRRHYPLPLQFSPSHTWAILRAGLPYLASNLGLVAYGQVDVLMISSLVNTTQVGWYGSASRLFGTLMFFPVIFTTAVFPSLTRAYTNSSNALPTIIRKSFDLMLVLSVPIGLGLFVIANQLVVLLYGADFAPSGPILALMGLVLIPTYQNILLGQFLTSTDRQNLWTVVMLVATALTLPLDLLLVPWCQQVFSNGAIAGSLSFLITEVGMVVAGIWLLPKGSLSPATIGTGLRILVAGLAMAACAWLLRDFFILIPIVAGGIVYIGMILLVRAIPADDLELFKQLGRNGLNRLRRRNADTIPAEGAHSQ